MAHRHRDDGDHATGHSAAGHARGNEPASHRRTIDAVAIALPAAALVWLVISHSFAAHFAETMPPVALSLNPRQPAALARQADALLAKIDVERMRGRRAAGGGSVDAPAPGTDASLDEVQRLARQALKTDPLNTDAMRILGDAAAAKGDDALARTWREAAAKGSLHQSGAHFQLMLAEVAAGDAAGALAQADILLRTRPDAAAATMPVLAKLTEDRRTAPAVKLLLRGNPPWRQSFFALLPAFIEDARAPLDLYLDLKGSAHPPTLAEQRSYLDFLIAKRFHELAYYTWLQLLRADQLVKVGPVFNANFERQASGLPFDWMLKEGAGVIAEIVPRPDDRGQRGLSVELGSGRVDFGGVSQWIMLGPGQYRLAARAQGELKGRRGLVWRIYCGPEPSAALAATPMIVGALPRWTAFEASFSVPATGCATQLVRLELDARSASEKLVTGQLWFDSVQIEKTGPPARKGAAGPLPQTDK